MICHNARRFGVTAFVRAPSRWQSSDAAIARIRLATNVTRSETMWDICFITGLAVFAVLSWGLLVLCDRLMGGGR
jgi:hypothetical protein